MTVQSPRKAAASPAAAVPEDSSLRAGRRQRRRELGRASGAPAVLAVIFVAYAVWLGPGFWAADIRMVDVHQSGPVMLLAMGAAICLAANQFDLSIAATASLASFLTLGLHLRSDWPLPACIAVAVVVGIIIGIVNGLLVAGLRVNAFIATLAMSGVIEGAQQVYSNGASILPGAGQTLPMWLSDFGNYQAKVPYLLGLASIVLPALCASATVWARQRVDAPLAVRVGPSVGIGVALVGLAVLVGIPSHISGVILFVSVLATATWFVMTFTSFGRGVYAVGGNPAAAHYAGVSVGRTTFGVFVTAGFFSALAGVMMAAMQLSATPGQGNANLLPAFAGAFLSTVLFSRGRFHVWGSIFGGLCLLYLAFGLVAGGVHYTWTPVINGVVLVVIVGFSSAVQTLKKLRPRGDQIDVSK